MQDRNFIALRYELFSLTASAIVKMVSLFQTTPAERASVKVKLTFNRYHQHMRQERHGRKGTRSRLHAIARVTKLRVGSMSWGLS